LLAKVALALARYRHQLELNLFRRCRIEHSRRLRSCKHLDTTIKPNSLDSRSYVTTGRIVGAASAANS